jgi:hypothetical protein
LKVAPVATSRSLVVPPAITCSEVSSSINTPARSVAAVVAGCDASLTPFCTTLAGYSKTSIVPSFSAGLVAGLVASILVTVAR